MSRLEETRIRFFLYPECQPFAERFAVCVPRAKDEVIFKGRRYTVCFCRWLYEEEIPSVIVFITANE